MKGMKAVHYFLTQVESLDGLPRETASALNALARGQTLHGLVVIPPQEYPVVRSGRWLHLPFWWRITPRRTLAFGEREILCVSIDSAGRTVSHVIPLAAITALEIATVLLYAWAEFAWMHNGQVERLKVEFNAVGEHLMRRKIERIRGAAFPECPAFVVPDPTVHDHVAAMPLKFRNYLHFALLRGETLRAAIYQPAFRRGPGRFRPYLAPSRAIGVTDRAIVIVEEDVAGHTTYGVITRYLPLEKLADVTFEPDEHCTWLRLRVGQGEASDVARLPLEASRATALEVALAPLAEPGTVTMSA